MTQNQDKRPVAVVTGASRGLGHGIAVSLGAAGYTVYVTGRSVEKPTGNWSGTVSATAEAVDAAGGKGIAVVCDHLDDDQTKAMFDQVRAEQGRLDVLVNNAFAMPDWAVEDTPFWQRPLSLWKDMIDIGLRSSYVAASVAAPLLLQTGPGGMIVNTSGPGARCFRHSLPYGVGKAGNDKLTYDMAHDLKPYGIATISFWHGLIATEKTVSFLKQGDVDSIKGMEDYIESVYFAGRIIAALHKYPDLMSLSGGTYYTAELADRFGIEDVDGRHPKSRRPLYGPPLFEAIA